jgi:hypothetical protein
MFYVAFASAAAATGKFWRLQALWVIYLLAVQSQVCYNDDVAAHGTA